MFHCYHIAELVEKDYMNYQLKVGWTTQIFGWFDVSWIPWNGPMDKADFLLLSNKVMAEVTEKSPSRKGILSIFCETSD